MDMDIKHWDLALLGSWPQVSRFMSKMVELPITSMPSSGSCIFELSGPHGSHLSFTWYDENTPVAYGSPAPSTVIAFSSSALHKFPLTSLMRASILEDAHQHFEEQFLLQLLQQTPVPRAEQLISLDAVSHFHSKYILRLPPTSLHLGWQVVKDAILDLLSPINPPWLDHPDIPDPRPFLRAVNDWDLSRITSIEASFDFCEQHSFTLSCLNHKLQSTESHLQARLSSVTSIYRLPMIINHNHHWS